MINQLTKKLKQLQLHHYNPIQCYELLLDLGVLYAYCEQERISFDQMACKGLMMTLIKIMDGRTIYHGESIQKQLNDLLPDLQADVSDKKKKLHGGVLSLYFDSFFLTKPVGIVNNRTIKSYYTKQYKILEKQMKGSFDSLVDAMNWPVQQYDVIESIRDISRGLEGTGRKKTVYVVDTNELKAYVAKRMNDKILITDEIFKAMALMSKAPDKLLAIDYTGRFTDYCDSTK